MLLVEHPMSGYDIEQMLMIMYAEHGVGFLVGSAKGVYNTFDRIKRRNRKWKKYMNF